MSKLIIHFQIPNAMKVSDLPADLLVIGMTAASTVIAGRICGMVFAQDGVIKANMAYEPSIPDNSVSVCWN